MKPRCKILIQLKCTAKLQPVKKDEIKAPISKDDDEEKEVTKKSQSRSKYSYIEHCIEAASSISYEARPKPKDEEEDGCTMKSTTSKTTAAYSDGPTKRKQITIKVNIAQISGDPTEKIRMLAANSIDDVKNKYESCKFIHYKNKRFLSSEILKEYDVELNGNLPLVIKRACSKQTIILTNATEVQTIDDPKILADFLRDYSKTYKNIISCDELARGGEAIVYRVTHTGLDEIVAKCPVFNNPDGRKFDEEEVDSAYQSIFYESQTLKLMPHEDYIAQIKEEIIEFNS